MRELFSNIVGHDEEIDMLLRLERVPHAFLFCGIEGIGKQMVAQAFAKRLLLESKLTQDEVLNQLKLGVHPDFCILEKAEDKNEIRVDEVRSLLEFLRLRSAFGRRKVAIINDAHLLNTSASNALLLSLEEAPSGAHIILVTSAEHLLLETIRSRCQAFYFGQLTEKEIAKILKGRLGEENLPAFVEYAENSLAGLDDIDSLIETIATKRTIARNFIESPSVGRAFDLFNDEAPEVSWRVLRQELRRALHQAPNKNLLAGRLKKTLELERQVKVRHLQPALQVASIFI